MSGQNSTLTQLVASLSESLKWLKECGVEHLSVPKGWRIPNLQMNLERQVTPDTEGASNEPSTSSSSVSRLLDEVSGTRKTPAKSLSTASTDLLPKAKPNPEFLDLPSSEILTAIDTFLTEENIVDEALREQFRRTFLFERLKGDFRTTTACPVCGGQNELVLPTLGSACRAVFVADQADEREQLVGIPYVGETGVLVARMIKAMGLRRDEVGFAYLNPCMHPEANADDLAEHWNGLFERYFRLAQPEVIVAFGECAARRLTGQSVAFPHLRGQWHEYAGIPVLSTFHPSALLQHPQGKSVVWGDLKNVMRKLGLSVSTRKGQGR